MAYFHLEADYLCRLRPAQVLPFMKVVFLQFYFIQPLLIALLAAGNCIASEQIRFNNFSQTITLEKSDDQYRLERKNQHVQLSGKLIVKTAASVNADELQRTVNVVESATLLYEGEYNYYLVELSNTIRLQNAIDELGNHPSVKLVQPDLLQLRNNAAYPGSELLPNPSYNKTLKLPELWKTTRGAGVKLAIIDDGINLNHPDLNHVSVAFQYDSEFKNLSASPKSASDIHGTKVAGIIFAAHDGIGIDGIAPDTQLIAVRQPDTWTSKTLVSFQIAHMAGADIVTCSWNSSWLLQPVAEVIEDLAVRGRHGLGTAVVIAAGNQGREILPLSTEASIDKAIVVGSANSQHRRLSFSNFGKSVDVYAFGSPSTSTTNAESYGPFSGTSLSAAIISGQIALFIAQNPQIPLSQISDQLHRLYSDS